MEQAAAQALERLGYRILEQNWHGGGGEIDLIAMEGTTLVFVEVRARALHGTASPEESLKGEKKQRLRRAAEAYLLMHPEYEEDVRLDFAAIDLTPSGRVWAFRLHRAVEWR